MEAEGITTYLFTQGVLGVVVIGLIVVVVKLYNKVERLEKEKVAILEAWRAETKEDGKDALDIVKGNSQSLIYIADKIEAGKANSRRQS